MDSEKNWLKEIEKEFSKAIVGQQHLLESLLISLLCEGHILLEGVPGVAKTLSIKTFAKIIGLNFKRIQFTPDLLPADILGTEIYNPSQGKFTTKKGPLFSNIILADEINRAPSKVQSALLEAMQEKQITLGEKSYGLNLPFMVLATQNPIEQEGTYNLPEAQVDRFMFKTKVSYPEREEEKEVIQLNLTNENLEKNINTILTLSNLKQLVKERKKVHIENKIIDYIVDIVQTTRSQNQDVLNFGASPRASIFLAKAAQAHAFLQGKDYVSPDDVKEISHLVLEHRLILSYEAEAEGLTKEKVIDDILIQVKVP